MTLPPFEGLVVCALIVFWLAIWSWLLCAPGGRRCAAVHTAPVGQQDVASALGSRSVAQVEFYQRKLRRMQVFAWCSTVSGFALILSCFFSEDPAVELLVAFGPVHQVFFAMSVSHWALNIYEDCRTRSFLGQGLAGDSGGGLALFPLNLLCGPRDIMLVMYFLHHAMTVVAYCYSLATHRLGGVMVQGLIFEFPVAFMLRRELAVASDPMPRWLTKQATVDLHWAATYGAWVLGRGPSLALWIFSVVPGYGAERLAESLRYEDLVMYHVMAAFFTSINIRMMGLLLCWHGQDRDRVLALATAQQAAGGPQPAAAAPKAPEAKPEPDFLA